MRSIRLALALLLSCWIALASQLHAQTQVTACLGATTTFTVPIANPPVGPVTWDLLSPPIPADVLYVDDQRLVVRWTEGGTYTLLAHRDQTSGDALQWEVTIAPGFEASVIATRGIDCGEKDGDKVHCLPDVNFDLTASPVGAVTWTSTGAISLSATTGATITATYTGTGQFRITATVTDASGCTDDFEYSGETFDVPAADITEAEFGPADEITVCRGQELNFSYLADLPIGYFAEWRLTGAPPEQSNTYAPRFDQAGVYTLQLYLSAICGCGAIVDEVTIVVEEEPGYQVLCPEVVCAGDVTTYVIDLQSGQALTCNVFTVTASAGGVPIIPTRVTSSVYTVAWPSAPTSAMGQVVITPNPSCGGCSAPTVINVPILGTIAPIERNGSCPARNYSLFTFAIPGATYLWEIIDDPDQTLEALLFPNSRSLGGFFKSGVAGFGAPAALVEVWLAGARLRVT